MAFYPAITGSTQVRPDSARRATLRELYSLPKTARLVPSRTALILVDFQNEFFSGKLALADAPRAAKSATQLLRWARRKGIAVIHVLQVAKSPTSIVFAPGSMGVREIPELLPVEGESVLTKSAGGGFTNTDLDEWLKTQHIETVIVAGLMTHLAVQLTASDATLRGYQVVIAGDATATRTLPSPIGGAPVDDAVLQRATLAALGDRFGEVMTTHHVMSLPLDP